MTSFIGKQEYHLYLFLTQEWVAEGHRHWPTRCNIFARSILKDIYLSAFIKLNFVRDKKMELQVLCLSLCNLAIITSVAPILLFLLQWSDILQHYTLPAVIQTAVNVNLSFIVRGQHQGFVPIKWFFYFATLRPAWDMFLSHLSSAWTPLRDLESPWLKNIKAAF